jgi:DNA-binding LacI/PurR family transcriptional regulator
VAQGRSTIATVAGPDDMTVGADRHEGWRAALEEAGMKPRRSLAVAADFTREGGAAAAAQLLDTTPGVDAIFAASDLMAAGVLDTLRQRGRLVPDDVAVVGFDDSELALSTDPPLTTVRQPIEQIGRTMAEQLLAQLDGAAPTGVILPTSLIVRLSA